MRLAMYVGAFFAAACYGEPPVWDLIEVYSNGEGSSQFAVLWSFQSGQQFLAGYTLTATLPGGSAPRSYTFPRDLPGDSAHRRLLIATQSFASLGLLAPDFVVPDGFFPLRGGKIFLADHGYAYLTLPTDGSTAEWVDSELGITWYDTAVATNFAGSSYRFSPAAPSSPPPPPPPPPVITPPVGPTPEVAVVEYYNAVLDHYFITALAKEISNLDAGSPPGWQRTSYTFNAFLQPVTGTFPVCRFFSVAFAPKSSHFHSPFAEECSYVKKRNEWQLETAQAFYIEAPNADGSCGGHHVPVYRLYNASQGGAPNHRYVIDTAVREQMLARGWIAEGLGPDGVGMCAPH